jgi:hypothetical protein
MHHWALFLRIIAKESSEAQPSKSWLFSYLLERYTASFCLLIVHPHRDIR